jgi:ribosome-associated protein
MPKTAGKKPKDKDLVRLILDTLDDMKAERVVCLDVKHLTAITDTMIIASGRSDRHVRAISDALLERCREEGFKPLGMEGQEGGEWVLVDMADAIVHIMLPRVREFYNIENLWDLAPRGELAGR